MLRRLSLGLLASAISVASLPAIAQEKDSADDLGVMNISLKDVVKPTLGFQTVAGTTISTSTRLGYRWLNRDRSTMYGINAGYDSRPIATGTTTNGIEVFNSQTPFFQQVAVNVELQSNQWGANVYGLIPVGKYGYGSDNIATMNSSFAAEPLTTVGLDVNYNISNLLAVMAGYYYQSCEKEPEIFENYAEGSGVKARLEYDISYQPQSGVAYSYDEILNPG